MFCTKIPRCQFRNLDMIFRRDIHQKCIKSIEEKFTEVEIKVPWGILSGKLWGEENKQPILAMHGWQDNAGSFDLLIPQLNYRPILAIDTVGHGLSSWLPKGIIYSDFVFFQIMRMIKRHFGWEKIKLLGHSLGALTSFKYAACYSDEVKFVIAIDALHPESMNFSKFDKKIKYLAKEMDQFLEFNEKVLVAPSYTKEEASQRWIKATDNSLTESTVNTLLIRGASIGEDGKLSYNRDPRLKFTALKMGFSLHDIQLSAKSIKCPYLVVRGADSKVTDRWFKDVIEIMKGNCKEFSLHKIPGTHHLHMVHPEEVARILNPFIERHDS